MLGIYLQGLLLSAAMILPLGPQNMFVISQGIRKQYHLMVAALCALSDIILICSGVFGGSALLSQSELLLLLVTWGGVAFLLWYGWGAFRVVLQKNLTEQDLSSGSVSRWQILSIMLAVTWLNPHVYLDTFVVLGSLGGQLQEQQRNWFALGAASASILWFFALALLAAWFSPWLRRPLAQRLINLLVGIVMWGIAWQLAQQGLVMVTG